METTIQKREIKETHTETIDWIRLSEVAVSVMLTTVVNKRKPVITYHIVDGTRWDAKLKTALKNKRPMIDLLTELKELKSPTDHYWGVVVTSLEAIQDPTVHAFTEIIQNNEKVLKKEKVTNEEYIFDVAFSERIDELFILDGYDHSIRDIHGTIVPTWRTISMLDDSGYDLKAVVDAFRDKENVIFSFDPDKEFQNHSKEYPEIQSIPHYNREPGLRDYSLEMRWLPTQKQAEIVDAQEYGPNFPCELTKLKLINFKPYELSKEVKKEREDNYINRDCSYGCSCCY